MSAPSPSRANLLLEAALSYARLGWRIVPLHNLTAEPSADRPARCTCQDWRDENGRGACGMPGKHPRFLKHAEIATTDESRLRAWWRAYPESNIGISLGKGSGIWALDKDPRNGGDQSYDHLVYEHGRLPYTTTALTGGGGTHEIWSWPEGDVPFAFDIEEGLQVLGEGHILVAAPSLHPSGRRYEWAPELGPSEMLPEPAPEWLLGAIRKALEPKPLAVVAGKSKFPSANIGPILKSCAWMRHCSDDAAILTEPEWYSMLAVVGRCQDGETLAHELSRAYSGYTQAETAEKLRHAMNGAGPTTCAKVRHSLGGARFCEGCTSWGRLKSPIVLGHPGRQTIEIPLGPEPPPRPAKPARPSSLSVRDLVATAIAQQDLGAVYQQITAIAQLPAQEISAIAGALEAGFPGFSARVFQGLFRSPGSVSDIPPDPPEVTEGVDGPDLCGFPMTESGNGERLVVLYGEQARYCHEMKKWLWWDGRRWAVDLIGRVHQFAKRMARLLYLQAASIPSENLRKATENWARKSEANGTIEASLKCFLSEPGITISANELDQHPFLLNCLNGMLDLDPAQPDLLAPARLIPHDRKKLLTKLCSLNYVPDAKCPGFLRFLERIMGGNLDAEPGPRAARLMAFLQKVFGLTLTGDVRERAIFPLWGDGANGKSTLLEIFRGIIPEYCVQINIDSLLAKPGGETNSTLDDLGRIRGARMVVTSEPDPGQRLRPGKLKLLASGAGTPINSRRLFENTIEFLPNHKLFIEMNDRPQLDSGDKAVWDRIYLVPFTVTIPKPERDKELKARLLREEAEGILAWAVRGCAAWLKEGLGNPSEVEEASAAWRAASDPLRQFLEDFCVLDEPEAWCLVKEMNGAYEAWAKEFGEKYPLNRPKFNEAMEKRGYRQGKRENGTKRVWQGIGLKPTLL